MEKYIKRSDLSSVMETLTVKALEHADKLSVTFSVSKFLNESTLNVCILDNETYARVAEGKYIIINDTLDDYDVMVETINEALKNIAAAEKQVIAETPSNNE